MSTQAEMIAQLLLHPEAQVLALNRERAERVHARDHVPSVADVGELQRKHVGEARISRC